MSDRVVRKRCAVLHIVQYSGMDAGGVARRTETGVRSPGTMHKAKNDVGTVTFDFQKKRTVPHIDVYLL